MSIAWRQQGRFSIGTSQKPLSFDDRSLQANLKTSLDLLGVKTLIILNQVHGSHIAEVAEQECSSQNEGLVVLPEADGILISDLSDHPISNPFAVGIRTADCLPIIVQSPKALALLHVGWKGMGAGLIEKCLQRVMQLNGSEAELTLFFGPAAKKCCYEVGTDVLEALHLSTADHKRKIDLQEIALERIQALSIKAQTICDPRCTISHEELHSFRRDRSTLRNMTFVMRRL